MQCGASAGWSDSFRMSVARRLWPGKDPLQQLYDYSGNKLPVIGVSANAHTMMLRNGNAGEGYVSIDSGKLAESMVLVRTAQPPENFAPLATTLARSLDSHLGPAVSTLRQSYDDKVGDSAQIAGIVSGMSLLARASP